MAVIVGSRHWIFFIETQLKQQADIFIFFAKSRSLANIFEKGNRAQTKIGLTDHWLFFIYSKFEQNLKLYGPSTTKKKKQILMRKTSLKFRSTAIGQCNMDLTFLIAGHITDYSRITGRRPVRVSWYIYLPLAMLDTSFVT